MNNSKYYEKFAAPSPSPNSSELCKGWNGIKDCFKKIPNILAVLNLTPDSFSDGGKFNKKNKGITHAMSLYKSGASIIDVGG